MYYGEWENIPGRQNRQLMVRSSWCDWGRTDVGVELCGAVPHIWVRPGPANCLLQSNYFHLLNVTIENINKPITTQKEIYCYTGHKLLNPKD